MYPFWEPVVAPLVAATVPRRIVEIGALHGDTTALLLDTLAPDVELHVIDPAPQFDPAEHERRFAGRYVFHRGLSLDVLPGLPPVDLALIDGDHNWYTVTHELEALRDTAHSEGRPSPVFVLHDVSWPYGRRDGYYAPETIPEVHRQPCSRMGIERADPGLVADGGLNAHIWNANREGGPRNGVLTALEDFASAHAGEMKVAVLDLFVGVAVAAEQRRLDGSAELRRFVEMLGDPDAVEELRATITESVRDGLREGALRRDSQR